MNLVGWIRSTSLYYTNVVVYVKSVVVIVRLFASCFGYPRWTLDIVCICLIFNGL